MTALYSNPPLADFLLSEAPGQRSRDNIMVVQTGAAVPSGTVLTQKTTGTATFRLDDEATGNPTCGAISVAAGAIEGTYDIVFTSATAYKVMDPNNTQVATGTLGNAFSAGGLGFTLTAGTTAAAAGDIARIDVNAVVSHLYAPATGSDSQDAVLYSTLPAATGNTPAVGFTGDCEVKRSALTGLTAAGELTLASKGIKVRGRVGIAGISTPAL